MAMVNPAPHQIITTPGDGHCLLHAIRLSWSHQLDIPPPSLHHLQCAIFVEALNNYDVYQAFLHQSHDKITYIKCMSDYILKKCYNSDFCDMVPLMLSNALSLDLTIFNKVNTTFQNVNITPLQVSNLHNLSISILRENDHFSGLAKHTGENNFPMSSNPQKLSKLITYTSNQLRSYRSGVRQKLPKKVKARIFRMQIWKPRAHKDYVINHAARTRCLLPVNIQHNKNPSERSINLCLMNVRSVKRKEPLIRSRVN